MALIIREFIEENDLSAQRELFSLCFPETFGTSASSLAYYRWKFTNFPSTTKSYQYVAYDDGTLVGYYAAIPFKYLIKGRAYTAGMVCDVMTHPERRGLGVFTKLGRFATDAMALKGVDFTTGYPIRPEVMPGHLKIGWQISRKLPMFIRVIRADKLLPKTISFLLPTVNSILCAVNSVIQFSRDKYVINIVPREEISEYRQLIDSLIMKWQSGQYLVLDKKFDFLCWRTSAPGSKYLFALAYHNTELIGLAIVSPTIVKGVPALAILDFLLVSNHQKAASALHKALFRLAVKTDRHVLISMSTARGALKLKFFSNFFLPTTAVFSLITKISTRTSVKSEDLSANNADFFWIDSDNL